MNNLVEIPGFKVGDGVNGRCSVLINPADFTDSSPYRAVWVERADYVPNRKPVNMDIVAIYPIAVRLPETAYKVYLFLLSKLNDNRFAVKARTSEVTQATGIKARWVYFGLNRLEQTGLIFRAMSSKNPQNRSKYSFIINPVFAWVGDQRDYLDLSGIDPE